MSDMSEYHICPYCGTFLAEKEECGCQNDPPVKSPPDDTDEMDSD